MQEMEYSFCADGVRKTDHLFLAGNSASKLLKVGDQKGAEEN